MEYVNTSSHRKFARPLSDSRDTEAHLYAFVVQAYIGAWAHTSAKLNL